jgi:hypothetical protein
MYQGIFKKNRAFMTLSSESSFRAISWSFRTEGLFDPRPAVFWVAPSSVGLQQDILQFIVRVGDGVEVVAKGAEGVHKRCLQLIAWARSQGPMEFFDGAA